MRAEPHIPTSPGMFVCAEKLADGSACREPFTRSDNLQRHVRVQHQGDGQKRGLTFVHVVPGADGKLREERDYFVPADGPRETGSPARDRAAQPEGAAATGGAEGHPRSNGRAAYSLPLPSYPVKPSRATPRQQRAITWLTQDARETAIRAVTRLMGDWGLGPSHAASCLLVPAKWRARNPQQLIRSLAPEDYPHAGSERLELKIDDHQTTFARALSWFRGWDQPRRGIDLDNFLEAGAWRRHDGSHLCGHGLCVNWNHVLYEPASVNLERESCFEEARQLRRAGQPVPPRCGRHREPCLLQLAALTNCEATLVQCHILSQRAGIALAERARPRNHRLPTFETRLPLGFAAPAPGATADAPAAAVAKGRIPKPDTHCTICRPRREFNSAVGLWGHLVHKHPDHDSEERLAAVRSTAAHWRAYWESAERLPPGCSPTMSKIEQVLGPESSWDDVLAWGLRP